MALNDLAQTEVLNAINIFSNKEYGYTYNALSDAIDEDGIIWIAHTEYDDDDYEDYGYYTLQVGYDIDTEEYVHIYDDENGKHEYRQRIKLNYFMEDLRLCDFDDFLVFDKK